MLKGAADDPDSGFEEFWQAYPKGRKGGKKDCRRKYAWIIKSGEATRAEIVAGAERYRCACYDDSHFTKAPLAWLNGAHWNDEDVPSPSDNRQSKPSGNVVHGRPEHKVMLRAKGMSDD